MSKKRGMSADEKAQSLQELYLEEVSVFNLKELEKLAPKKKGIVQQSVKDVNQALVDEGVVQTDKLGIGNFFWMFASQTYNAKQVQLEKAQAQLAAVRQSNEQLRERIAEFQREHASEMVSADERAAKKARLAELEVLDAAQLSQLHDLAELDPDTLAAMQADRKIAVDAANRWTDAVQSLAGHLRNQFNCPPEMIAEKYGIPADLDSIV